MWKNFKALFDSKETKAQKALGLYWEVCPVCNGRGTKNLLIYAGECSNCKGEGKIKREYV